MNQRTETEPPPPLSPFKIAREQHEQFIKSFGRRRLDLLLSLKPGEEQEKYKNKLLDQFVLLMKAKERQISQDTVARAILNKRTFQLRLRQALVFCHRHEVEATLLLLDGNKFKLVNDTYGHPVGDKVIQAMIQAVVKSVREDDLVGHYGGDEIAVLLLGTGAQDAEIVISRINQNVPQFTRQEVPQLAWEQTVSIGLAQVKSEDSEKTLLIKADQALYEAKKERYSLPIA